MLRIAFSFPDGGPVEVAITGFSIPAPAAIRPPDLTSAALSAVSNAKQAGALFVAGTTAYGCEPFR
jgi:hypothetical protein